MKKLIRTLAIVGLVEAAVVVGVAEAAGVAHPSEDGNLPFLFAAFAVTWAAFFAYLIYVARRQRELHREVEALTRALLEKEEAE